MGQLVQLLPLLLTSNSALSPTISFMRMERGQSGSNLMFWRPRSKSKDKDAASKYEIKINLYIAMCDMLKNKCSN